MIDNILNNLRLYLFFAKLNFNYKKVKLCKKFKKTLKKINYVRKLKNGARL